MCHSCVRALLCGGGGRIDVSRLKASIRNNSQYFYVISFPIKVYNAAILRPAPNLSSDTRQINTLNGVADRWIMDNKLWLLDISHKQGLARMVIMVVVIIVVLF